MRGNRPQRRQPKLDQIGDGDHFSCQEVEDWLTQHELEIQGLDAVLIGPAGYLDTVQVQYPMPASLLIEVRPVKKATACLRVKLSELWLDVSTDKLYIVAVYDTTDRSPQAYLKVEH